LAAVVWLSACGPKQKVIEVAVAVPLTGDMGTEGSGVRRAVELAVEQANASGRFPYRLEAVLFDDRNEPREAESVANLIASDARVAGVIGHYTSGCALAAAPIYARSRIPMLTPSATVPELTRAQLAPEWPGARVVFRFVATDDMQGAFAGEYVARRLKKRRVAVVHDGTAYGKGLAEQFAKSYRAAGGRVLLETAIRPGQKDFAALISRLKPADAVFFGGVYTEAGLLLKQTRAAGLTLAFVSGDGSRTSELVDVAGDAADGAFATMVAPPIEALPKAQAFAEAFKKRWPDSELRPFDHVAYDAAQTLFDALAQAGRSPGHDAVLAALRRTRRQGLIGPISFDAKGDIAARRVTMTRARASDRSFAIVP
jgi:branched-chain amino acid transport system substrate-binding protein